MRRGALLGGVPSFLRQTGDNPEGVDPAVFAAIEKASVPFEASGKRTAALLKFPGS